MDQSKALATDTQDASVIRGGGSHDIYGIEGVYHFECRDKDGNLKWTDTVKNVITTAGKNDILDKYFGITTIAGIFMGLISSVGYSAGVVIGDTMASHAGWNEAQGATNLPDYVSATRPIPSFNAASGGAKATSAAVAFVITGTGGTIKGSFLTTVSTKGGTTGTLISGGTFTGGDKVVSSGDTVNATYTVTLT